MTTPTPTTRTDELLDVGTDVVNHLLSALTAVGEALAAVRAARRAHLTPGSDS